jgi:hypothetical protein
MPKNTYYIDYKRKILNKAIQMKKESIYEYTITSNIIQMSKINYNDFALTFNTTQNCKLLHLVLSLNIQYNTNLFNTILDMYKNSQSYKINFTYTINTPHWIEDL